ncbi:MAG TPA: AAA family ATPase, partial [Acidothermaceae bacterium]|nr:AAA family ATPase [Acidothermaceae bacterium]
TALGLWCPATFAGDHRKRANVESVYALGFDVDAAPVPTEAELRTALAGRACLFHSSSSATPSAPRWRLLLLLSRPVTATEYDRLWARVASSLPFAVGAEAKDPSRGWYVPRVPAEGDFVGVHLDGVPLDVDALLAAAPAPPVSTPSTPQASPAPTTDRRPAAARLLAGSWPALGSRHEAKCALAGAFWRAGWSEDEAVAFLREMYSHIESPDGGKPEVDVHSTYERAATTNVTGWATLGRLMDAGVVDAARGLLTFGPLEEAHARLEAGGETTTAPTPTVPPTPPAIELLTGVELAQPLPDLTYFVKPIGLVAGGGATHLIAGYGFSGKTVAAQAMLLALASGQPVWSAFPVPKPLRVVHIDLEQGELTRRRYQRLARAMGVDLRGLEDRLLVSIMPRLSLRDEQMAVWRKLMEGRDLILIDSLKAATGGLDENDSRIRDRLDAIGQVSHETGCRTLVIHHARKPKDDAPSGRYAIRGSGGIYDASDAAYVFSAEKGTPITVEHCKARSTGEEVDNFSLVVSDVTIGLDERAGLRVQLCATDVADRLRAEKKTEARLTKVRADAEVVRRVLRAKPGLGTRELRAEVKTAGDVSPDRLTTALALIDAEVETRDEVEGRARVTRHFLREPVRPVSTRADGCH